MVGILMGNATSLCWKQARNMFLGTKDFAGLVIILLRPAVLASGMDDGPRYPATNLAGGVYLAVDEANGLSILGRGKLALLLASTVICEALAKSFDTF